MATVKTPKAKPPHVIAKPPKTAPRVPIAQRAQKLDAANTTFQSGTASAQNKTRAAAFTSYADQRAAAAASGGPKPTRPTSFGPKDPGTHPIRDLRTAAGLPTKAQPFHLPGGGPNGPIESGPRPTATNLPNIQEAIDAALAKLPPDQAALARQRIGSLGSLIQGHIADAAAGGILPFHPALEHAHGPNGEMIPAIGQGGLAGIPKLGGLLSGGLNKKPKTAAM